AAAAGRNGASLAVAAIAGTVRPELALLPFFVFVDRVLVARPRRGGGTFALAVGALGAAAAPFFFNRILTGLWLPGSFQAKVARHGALAAIAEGRMGLLPGIVVSNPQLYLGPLLAALLRDNGALLLLAPLGFRLFAGGETRTHLPWMIGVLLPATIAVLAPFGGPAFH